MAANLNRVQLIGRLGLDPEYVTTSSGKALTKLRVATTEYWTDSATNDRRERTEWHNVLTWDKTAQFAKQYLSKGNLVYVEGSLRSNEFIDQAGIKKKFWDINANTVMILQSERKDNREFQKKAFPKDDFKDDVSPVDSSEDDDVVPF